MDWKRIEDKQDKIVEDINEIKVILAKQHVSLDHHIRRTELAEENLTLIRKELEPIKDHVSKVKGSVKFIGIIGTIVGIIYSIIDIIKGN